MKKIAMTPDQEIMLKGILSDAGVGAGIGAVSMGAANLLGDTDNEGKKRSLLKSMLLGGMLGGVTGGGLRAVANRVKPSLAKDPSSGLSQLVNKGPGAEDYAAKPNTLRNTMNVLAIDPRLTAGASGALGAGVHALFGRNPAKNGKVPLGDLLVHGSGTPMTKNLIGAGAANKNIAAKLLYLLGHGWSRYIRLSPLVSGAAGAAAGYGSGAFSRDVLERAALYDRYNNPELSKIINKQ